MLRLDNGNNRDTRDYGLTSSSHSIGDMLYTMLPSPCDTGVKDFREITPSSISSKKELFPIYQLDHPCGLTRRGPRKRWRAGLSTL